MPTYEYYCDECDTEIQIAKSFDDAERAEQCAVCRVVLRRVYTAPPAIFRGTGWGKDGL